MLSWCISNCQVVAAAVVLFVLATVTGCSALPASNAPTPTPEVSTADAIVLAYRQYGGEIVTLNASDPVATVNVVNVVGTTPAYEVSQGNPPCAGFIQTLPNLVFTLDNEEPLVQVSFEGNTTTTLLMIAEGENIVCDEDSSVTRTPELLLAQAGPGRYGVWVGRTDMQEPVNGRLTISLGTE